MECQNRIQEMGNITLNAFSTTCQPKQAKQRPPSAKPRRPSSPHTRAKQNKNQPSMTINLDLRSGKVIQLGNKDLGEYTHIEDIAKNRSPKPLISRSREQSTPKR